MVTTQIKQNTGNYIFSQASSFSNHSSPSLKTLIAKVASISSAFFTTYPFSSICLACSIYVCMAKLISFCIDKVKHHSNSALPSLQSSMNLLKPELVRAIAETPRFNGYLCRSPSKSIFDKMSSRGKTLTSLTTRPVNLFFRALHLNTNQPGQDNPFFCFKDSESSVRQTVLSKNDEEVVSFTAKSDPALAQYLGTATYRLSYKELKELLASQTIHISSLIPANFYIGLQEAIHQDQYLNLPGNDACPYSLETIISSHRRYKALRSFLQKVDHNPRKFGFTDSNLDSLQCWTKFKTLSIYEVAAMVIKTETYYSFVTDGYQIEERQVGNTDQIHMINMCGIRGTYNTKTVFETQKQIMTETFTAALRSVGKDGFFIMPALGMGVWRGTPELYWEAFLDAVSTLDIPLTKIFISPGHQKTISGQYAGCAGEEFQDFLARYQKKHHENQNLQNVVNLFEKKTDVLLFAKYLKKECPNKTVGLVNAADPDVTLGNACGQYLNHLNHPPTTEENYASAGSMCLGFRGITHSFQRFKNANKHRGVVSWFPFSWIL